MIDLLGFYDYTVILTEVSLLCAVIGISHAIGENHRVSMVCLILCGICDAFDGHIARTKKNRSKEEKHFGIQLDSLCDLICFGILPGIICYQNGVNVILVGLYCLAAVIRLAWFNVLEWNRQQCDEGHSSAYHGLPVTSISGILPLIFVLGCFLPVVWMPKILSITLTVAGSLFIIDFKLKKPGLKEIILLIAGIGITLGILMLIALRKGGIIS